MITVLTILIFGKLSRYALIPSRQTVSRHVSIFAHDKQGNLEVQVFGDKQAI